MTEAPQFFTIGVYGSAQDAFFDSLTNAGIDTFCDIRRRRGVRGSEYAFVNSTRLQKELADRSIRYFHFLDLSPSNEIRQAQYAIDKKEKVGKRSRSELSPLFKDAYREACLSSFESRKFVESLGPEAKCAVLFCVERDASACHRSLVAERLEADLGITVTHLMP